MGKTVRKINPFFTHGKGKRIAQEIISENVGSVGYRKRMFHLVNGHDRHISYIYSPSNSGVDFMDKWTQINPRGAARKFYKRATSRLRRLDGKKVIAELFNEMLDTLTEEMMLLSAQELEEHYCEKYDFDADGLAEDELDNCRFYDEAIDETIVDYYDGWDGDWNEDWI